MRTEWVLVTGPTVEPLSLAAAKLHCRVDADDENALLSDKIAGARLDAEQYMWRGLYTQTWKLELSDFADLIWLPMAGPLQSVTSVKYYDTAGTLTTLATSEYIVDTTSLPGRIVRAPEKTWPSLQSDRVMRVEIVYVVGYDDVDNVPQRIVDGIALMTRARYERQTGTEWAGSVAAAHACWESYRLWWMPPACAA